MDQRRLDELFALPPEEFTEARGALSRALSEEGDREAATEVRSLRRPTTAAWAVNQVARSNPDLLGELVAAGERIRDLQRRAASGLAAEDFGTAMAERRRLVRRLTEEAATVLEDAGRLREQHLAAIGRTFEAAGSDRTAAELVRSARLTREIAPPSGFDAIEAFAVVPGERQPEPAPPTGKDATRRRALSTAQRDVERWTRRAATAREEHRAQEREASERQKELQAVERELGKARRRLEEARKRADRTARKAAEAERELDRAESELAELRRSTGAR